MTPIFFDSSCNNYSSYPSDHYEDNLNNHQFLSPNSQPSSSSTSFATHLFLNSNHQTGIFNPELQPPQHQHEGDNFGSQAYKDHRIENRNGKEVEFSTWNNSMSNDLHQVKWMSSKMRVMLKMKKSVDHVNPNTYTTIEATNKLEDHKLPTSPPMEETDNSSNDNSSNSTSSNNNNNIPIRVCSDCNTTKTPLWRSGPRGPKSLCNACGIRQRKARRAMTAAAAAAENGNSNIFNGQSLIAPLKVKKIQHKDHKKSGKGYVTKYKKRQYLKQPSPPPPPVLVSSPCGAPSLSPSSSPSPSLSPSPSPARRNCVEEFLASLSRNLAFYHVFPQDEKEAAILLMALSCGYAHET